LIRHVHIEPNTSWRQNGVTVAGNEEDDDGFNLLLSPFGFEVDDDQTIVIADYFNHRVIEWQSGATSGQVVAGGEKRGNRNDQLNYPTDLIIDKQVDKLIICDRENWRVVRWPRRGGKSGETIISYVKCFGLTMDANRFLYVSDLEKHEVRRWRIGETQGTLVAGGNGRGNRADQLNSPHYIFIDGDQSIFVSDSQNHRVMKWVKDAKEGIVVAGGQGEGNAFTQLSSSEGIFVDQLGSVYVADCSNYRVMRWLKGATDGSLVVGNEYGNRANQLSRPMGLSFDSDGNLYVADYDNHRIQKFDVNRIG
jgi:sugar lactone lactonase YvrE